MTQKLITDYFKTSNINKKRKRNNIDDNETFSWNCLECGVDMGIDNPRQLCRKSYCGNVYFF